MELRTDTWDETSPLVAHPEAFLHPLHISPNSLVSGIRKIAQIINSEAKPILRNREVNPSDKQIIKTVRLCWELACELPTGKKVIRACKECLKLPDTEDSRIKTRFFSFKVDGTMFSYPAYFKDALAADSPYFKGVFSNGVHESSLAIHRISSKSFANLMNNWLDRSLPRRLRSKDFRKNLKVLKDGIPLGIIPKKAEDVLCLFISRLNYEEHFAQLDKIIHQFLPSSSDKIKIALCQFFLTKYLVTRNKEIKARCENNLQLLGVQAISRQMRRCWQTAAEPYFTHSEVRFNPYLLSQNNAIAGINRIAQLLKSMQADPTHKKTINIVRGCWQAAARPHFTHFQARLNPYLLSPNDLTSGINRIAQILKNRKADPTHKKTIKIVRRCWQAAAELPTGKKILRAYRACLGLPKTEDVKEKTKKITLKMDDGGFFSFAACLKNALAADSPYFKALFANGMLESSLEEIAIHDVTSESFANLMRYWLADPLSLGEKYEDIDKNFNILIDGTFFRINPKAADRIFSLKLISWNYEEYFEYFNEIVDQILPFSSEKVKSALCQFFLDK